MKKAFCIIVGGGMSGLMAARVLQQKGLKAIILDKGRGIGGRMATRRIKNDSSREGVFDYGAQYFTVRNENFRARIQEWIEQDVIKEWSKGFPDERGKPDARQEPRYMGVNGIRSVAKHLAADLDIFTSTRVTGLNLAGSTWQIQTDRGDVFQSSSLLLTPPVPQSLELLEKSALQLPQETAGRLKNIAYHRCIALLLLMRSSFPLPAPGALKLSGEPIRWIADNQQKGISPAPAVTLHAGPEFSLQNWDADPDRIAEQLLNAAQQWIGKDVFEYQIHRWRYSQPCRFYNRPFAAVNLPAPLLLAGDAFLGDRIEAAALSGISAAEHLASFFKS